MFTSIKNKLGATNQSKVDIVVSKQLLVYIVDDEEFYQSLVELNLRKFEKFFTNNNFEINFKIKKFSNGADCIVEMDAKPDIIFLDYFLKVSDTQAVNGDYIFKKIIDIVPNQKVVFISGQHDPSVVYNLIQLGIRDYIYKDETMYACLEEFLNEYLLKTT